MKTLIVILVACSWCYQPLQGQGSQEIQYAAYLKAGKSLWQRSIEEEKLKHGAGSFECALATFGLLNATMATRDETTFDDYADKLVDILQEVIDQNPNWGEPQALLSGVYGLKIAYSPIKGMIYGPKSGSLISAALKLQPESPLVQKLHGSYKLYTPSMFGGDPREAVKAYFQATALYETGESKENWLYLDSLIGLAMAFHKNDQPALAIETLKKAISLEPEFLWAKSILNDYQGK